MKWSPNRANVRSSSDGAATFTTDSNIDSKNPGAQPMSRNTSDTSDIKRAAGHVTADRAQNVKRILAQCEAIGWPFKKKLNLSNLNLRFEDIPTERICSRRIGRSLIRLSLRDNRLIAAIPEPLVTGLVRLRTLDVSNCNVKQLPVQWNLPSLKKLCLGRNKLTEFPNEVSLTKASVLHFCNQICSIIIAVAVITNTVIV